MAWVALVALAFDPAPWQLQLPQYLPPALMAVVLCLIVRDLLQGRIRWYLVAWFTLVAVAFAKFPIVSLPLRHLLPTWLWQIILSLSASGSP